MHNNIPDNPFDEADDGDHTVFRPMPGGRRSPVSQGQSATAAPIADTGDETRVASVAPRPVLRQPRLADPAESSIATNSPLLAAATPLLQLLARLRNTLTPPDAGDLRERAGEAARKFERRGQADGLPSDQLRFAHYALCASLDDVVLNTPWGSTSRWMSHSLISSFHNEVQSGEQFFVLLEHMRQDPLKYLPVLQLMYLCLSLGFMGRFRLSPRGPAQIDQLREDLYATIAKVRPGAEAELSPCWQGVAASYRPLRMRIPLWVAGAAGLAAIGGLFVWFSISLNEASDAVYEQALQARPTQMPTVARAALPQTVRTTNAEPGMLDRLRLLLKPDIDANQLAVLGTEDTPLIRVLQSGMFASGSARLEAKSMSLLDHIGAVLKQQPGSIQVVGYTDDQAIRTVRFPSNFQLSSARAAAAGTVIAHALDDPARLSTEGRASADPIAPNTTPEGREANRRIEIVLNHKG